MTFIDKTVLSDLTEAEVENTPGVASPDLLNQQARNL